jgi:K+-transporting ATPase ATPase C chain
MPNNAAGSSGSNQGPLNPALTDAVKGRIDALKAADPGNIAPVPVDLVTASASGLDPEISIAAAQYQVRRIAAVRGIPEESVRGMIEREMRGRVFGFFGEPRINVLALNMALDGKTAHTR